MVHTVITENRESSFLMTDSTTRCSCLYLITFQQTKKQL